MELCKEDLRSFIRRRVKARKQFTESEVRQIFGDLIQILHVLHAMDIVHLDIKPENVLIRKEKDRNTFVLADYTLSIETSKIGSSTLVEGDPRYQAPEIFHSIDPSQLNLKSSDIYSLGLLIFELVSGCNLPKGGPEFHEIRSQGYIRSQL